MSNKLCNWWNTCHIKTSDQSWQMPMNFVDETEALFKEHAAWVMYTNEVPPKGLQRLYNLFLVVWSYRMGLLGYLSLVPSLIVSQKLVKLAACFFMFFFVSGFLAIEADNQTKPPTVDGSFRTWTPSKRTKHFTSCEGSMIFLDREKPQKTCWYPALES